MEVHPPEHPIFTWKQFLIHMATVCLGLLIALGLEQSVEALHRHEQARELREALGRETQQIIHDQTASAESHEAINAWAAVRRQQLYDGLWNNKPVPPTPRLPNYIATLPADPIFSAALANGRAALLTPEEVNVYQDIHSQIARYSQQIEDTRTTDSKWLSFERSFPQRADNISASTSVDYTHVSAEDRRRDLELFNEWMRAWGQGTHNIEQLVSVEREIAKGERNLDKIHTAELHPWKPQGQENALHTVSTTNGRSKSTGEQH